eukprot:scaffold2775_cov343-Prasinococcus_capsulatus_cf.AAC.10
MRSLPRAAASHAAATAHARAVGRRAVSSLVGCGGPRLGTRSSWSVRGRWTSGSCWCALKRGLTRLLA